ncbi:glutathione S-transferase [Fragilaria crotonensis]|nr:glutathione S-transferase [Fragilaria crotonensis]
MSATTKDLTLYHFAGASSFATNVVLHWTGQSATVLKPAETAKGLSGDYADQINPAAVVPSIVLPNGNILTENIAVLNYIAKTAGREDLAGGDDLWEQSQVLKWSSFLSSDVHSSFWLVFFTDRFTTSDDPAALAQVKEAGLKRVHEKVTILENHMKGRQWLVGDSKTFADAHLYVFVRWMTAYMTPMMEDFPSLKSFGERMADDEGVKAALQYEDEAIWGLN